MRDCFRRCGRLTVFHGFEERTLVVSGPAVGIDAVRQKRFDNSRVAQVYRVDYCGQGIDGPVLQTMHLGEEEITNGGVAGLGGRNDGALADVVFVGEICVVLLQCAHRRFVARSGCHDQRSVAKHVWSIGVGSGFE